MLFFAFFYSFMLVCFAENLIEVGFLGTWKDFPKAPTDFFVCGAATKYVQYVPNIDNAGVTGLKLSYCNKQNWQIQIQLELSNSNGAWGNIVMCPINHYVYGFRIQQEPQTFNNQGNNVGMTGLKIYCRSPLSNTQLEVNVSQGYPGKWKKSLLSDTNFMRDVSVRLFVKQFIPYQDDTGLNGINATMALFSSYKVLRSFVMNGNWQNVGIFPGYFQGCGVDISLSSESSPCIEKLKVIGCQIGNWSNQKDLVGGDGSNQWLGAKMCQNNEFISGFKLSLRPFNGIMQVVADGLVIYCRPRNGLINPGIKIGFQSIPHILYMSFSEFMVGFRIKRNKCINSLETLMTDQ